MIELLALLGLSDANVHTFGLRQQVHSFGIEIEQLSVAF
jgi:hypothetical protein